MKRNYEKLWSDIVKFIQNGDGVSARKIWDEIVEDAWKYEHLSD